MSGDFFRPPEPKAFRGQQHVHPDRRPAVSAATAHPTPNKHEDYQPNELSSGLARRPALPPPIADARAPLPPPAQQPTGRGGYGEARGPAPQGSLGRGSYSAGGRGGAVGRWASDQGRSHDSGWGTRTRIGSPERNDAGPSSAGGIRPGGTASGAPPVAPTPIHTPATIAAERERNPPTTTVFVTNMALDTTEKEISELFGPYGNIDLIRISPSQNKDRAAGFAHVSFDLSASAVRALELDGTANIRSLRLRVVLSDSAGKRVSSDPATATKRVGAWADDLPAPPRHLPPPPPPPTPPQALRDLPPPPPTLPPASATPSSSATKVEAPRRLSPFSHAAPIGPRIPIGPFTPRSPPKPHPLPLSLGAPVASSLASIANPPSAGSPTPNPTRLTSAPNPPAPLRRPSRLPQPPSPRPPVPVAAVARDDTAPEPIAPPLRTPNVRDDDEDDMDMGSDTDSLIIEPVRPVLPATLVERVSLPASCRGQTPAASALRERFKIAELKKAFRAGKIVHANSLEGAELVIHFVMDEEAEEEDEFATGASVTGRTGPSAINSAGPSVPVPSVAGPSFTGPSVPDDRLAASSEPLASSSVFLDDGDDVKPVLNAVVDADFKRDPNEDEIDELETPPPEEARVLFPVGISGSWADSLATKTSVESFLVGYFSRFDSYRASLTDYYSISSELSMRIAPEIPARAIGPQEEFNRGFRALKSPSRFRTPQPIVNAITALPAGSHDLSKIVWDAHAVREAGGRRGPPPILLVMHGQFEEFPSHVVRDVDRSFLLVPRTPLLGGPVTHLVQMDTIVWRHHVPSSPSPIAVAPPHLRPVVVAQPPPPQAPVPRVAAPPVLPAAANRPLLPAMRQQDVVQPPPPPAPVSRPPPSAGPSSASSSTAQKRARVPTPPAANHADSDSDDSIIIVEPSPPKRADRRPSPRRPSPPRLQASMASTSAAARPSSSTASTSANRLGSSTAVPSHSLPPPPSEKSLGKRRAASPADVPRPPPPAPANTAGPALSLEDVARMVNDAVEKKLASMAGAPRKALEPLRSESENDEPEEQRTRTSAPTEKKKTASAPERKKKMSETKAIEEPPLKAPNEALLMVGASATLLHGYKGNTNKLRYFFDVSEGSSGSAFLGVTSFGAIAAWNPAGSSVKEIYAGEPKFRVDATAYSSATSSLLVGYLTPANNAVVSPQLHVHKFKENGVLRSSEARPERPHRDGVTALALVDRKRFATSGGDKTVYLWNVHSKGAWDTELVQVPKEHQHTAAITSLEFSSKGSFLVSGGMDKRVTTYDVEALSSVWSARTTSPITSVQSIPNQPKLVLARRNQEDRQWAVFDVRLPSTSRPTLEFGFATTNSLRYCRGSFRGSTLFVHPDGAYGAKVVDLRRADKFQPLPKVRGGDARIIETMVGKGWLAYSSQHSFTRAQTL